MMPLALLAGGLATRMRPETEKIPKSLLIVAGKPFIAHQLELLAANGIENVIICVGHLGDMIEAYVKDGKAFGLNARYSYDGSKALGTGGALLKAAKFLGSRFFVMYGDSYLTVNYKNVADAYTRSGKTGLMTVYKNKNQWDTSNAVFSNGLISAYSKKTLLPEMEYIDYGLGVLNSKAFDGRTPGDNFDLAAVYEYLVSKNDLAGYETPQRFYEIGSREGLLELNTVLNSRG